SSRPPGTQSERSPAYLQLRLAGFLLRRRPEQEALNAIEMRALRKVYKGSGKSKPGGSSYSARWAPPGATTPPSGDVIALESLDLDIRAGEFFGLLGPNGAGKTTAIGILTT